MEVYFKNLTPEEGTPKKLLKDLNALGRDTEELFRASEGRLAETSKEKFLDRLERVKATCRYMENAAKYDSDETTGAQLGFPYGTMGIVFGLGLLAGVLMTRGGGNNSSD